MIRTRKTIWHRCLGNIPVYAWLLLLCFTLIGYWPVSTSLFSLKNDAFVYFLPSRFAISDAIQQGQWPWWTPFYYMGHPLHADMQSGAWNPIVWLISSFTRYNLSWLQAETLLYIFIGALGMYKLVSRCTDVPAIRLLISVSYLFCGFIIDTAQITVWTGSAAFLPLVFHYFLILLNSTTISWNHISKLSLSLYMLLTAGYPSFLIMAIYIMAVLVVYRVMTDWKQPDRKRLWMYRSMSLLFAGLLFSLMALPALYSYVDFLPYYQRSGGASLTEANQNPLDPLSVISFLFPFSVTRDHTWLQSNPTARSLFIGLVPVLSFAVYRFKKFTRTDGLIFAGVFFFFLFSLGDATPIRSWCYQLLPGMNYFRHPGTMRLFAIIGILFLASRNLSIIYHLPSTQARSLWRKTGWTLLLISIAILILAIIGSVKWLSTISQLSLHDRQDLKWAYDHIGFYQALMLDTVLLSCLLVGLLFLQKKGRLGLKQIFLIQIVHLLVSAQWTIPFTMVSQVSPTAINRFIQQSPNHLPAESWQQPVQVSTALEDAYQRQYGAASVYLKHVCWINPLVNPSIPNRLRELDSMPVVRAQLFRFPVFYGAQNHPDILMDDHDAPYYLQVSKSFRINALELQPNDWQLSVTGEAETRLCVCQNYNANWQVQIDGKNARVEPGNHAFMSVLVPAGNHRIRWHYELPYLNICVWIGILTMLVVVLLTGWPKRRSA